MKFLAVAVSAALLACGVTESIYAEDVQVAGLSFRNSPFAVDHGYVVTEGADRNQIQLFAPDGQKVYEATIHPPGAEHTTVLAAAVDADGTVAVAYHLGPLNGGLALLDASGESVRYIGTGAYQPAAICFASDHSLWLKGQEYAPGHPDYFVFRKLSKDGQALGAFVKRSELPAWEGEGVDQATAPFVYYQGIRASGNRIGASLMLGPFKSGWVELDLNGKLNGVWTWTDSLERGHMLNAMTSGNQLYANVWNDHKIVGVAQFDRATSQWKNVQRPEGAERLLGADGNDLIFRVDGMTLRRVPDWTQTAVSFSPEASSR